MTDVCDCTVCHKKIRWEGSSELWGKSNLNLSVTITCSVVPSRSHARYRFTWPISPTACAMSVCGIIVSAWNLSGSFLLTKSKIRSGRPIQRSSNTWPNICSLTFISVHRWMSHGRDLELGVVEDMGRLFRTGWTYLRRVSVKDRHRRFVFFERSR